MYSYGQYCPVARAVELLGDRWTLLVVRDLLSGSHHFNELERGLPGIPRALLADRLRRLVAAGIAEKRTAGKGRTEYHLTPAGLELQSLMNVLLVWGTRWTLDEPRPDELDPVLLLWWMRGRVRSDQIPEGVSRLVVQFDFVAPVAERYWLVITREDVSVCIKHPGYEIDVLVTADLATLFQVWLGRVRYVDALRSGSLCVETTPTLERIFPRLFALSAAAKTVRRVRAEMASASPVAV